MAQATIPTTPHQQRINEAQSKGKELIYGIFIGMLLVMIAIWIGSTVFSDTEGYLTNVFTEVISVIATIFVIDRINQWRDDRRVKNQLLEELKSTSTSPAVNALDRLRREGWLDDDYFTTKKGKNLQRANWEGAYIGELNFEGANLVRANFKNATNYDGKENQVVNFKDANLIGAHLEGARLYGAHLQGADLSMAHLEGATLLEAHLEGTNLFQTHLQGTDLFQTHLENANLRGAYLQGAYLQQAHLQGTTFWGSHLQEANLSESRLEGANLMQAHLEGANLTAAHLEGADLSMAHLEGATLLEARVNNVRWTWSDGRHPAILPDGTTWTPEQDMQRFTKKDHPDFETTLKAINEIRAKLGYEQIEG